MGELTWSPSNMGRMLRIHSFAFSFFFEYAFRTVLPVESHGINLRMTRTTLLQKTNISSFYLF